VAIKKPQLHPVICLIGGEWEEANTQNRAMNWGKISLSYLQGVCHILAEQNPDWHRDLHGMDLGNYLVGVPPEKMWWRVNPPAVQGPEDGTSEQSTEYQFIYLHFIVTMDDPPAAPLPPAGWHTRSSKGKGREQRAQVLDAPVPHGSRGTKRSITGEGVAGPMASASDEEPLDEEGDVTPRKSGAPVPCVEVNDASPPHPTRRAKIVATGDVCVQLDAYPCFLLIRHSGQVWPLQEGFSGDVRAPGQQPSDHSMPALCSLEEDLHSSRFMGPAHNRSDECEYGQYVCYESTTCVARLERLLLFGVRVSAS
jgi:hypothetical protein